MEDSVLFRRFADALAGRTIPQDAARELAVRMEEDLGVRDGVLLMFAYGMDASKAWRFSADPKAHEKEVVALMAPAFDAPSRPCPPVTSKPHARRSPPSRRPRRTLRRRLLSPRTRCGLSDGTFWRVV